MCLFVTKDCSPLGSSVHGILQVRILEWVVISFSMEFIKKKSQIRSIRWFVQGTLAIRCYNLTRDTGDLIPKSRLFSLHQWFSVSTSPSNLLCKSNSWVSPPSKESETLGVQHSNLYLTSLPEDSDARFCLRITYNALLPTFPPLKLIKVFSSYFMIWRRKTLLFLEMNPRDLDMDTRVHHRKPKLYLPYFQIQRALEIKTLSNRLLSQGYIPD